MNNEIVYVCHSINNKNVRGNELKILRKIEKELCFEFGESERNIKKRIYKNREELNKDFEEVKKIKERLESEAKKDVEEAKEDEDEKKNKTKEYNRKNLF